MAMKRWTPAAKATKRKSSPWPADDGGATTRQTRARWRHSNRFGGQFQSSGDGGAGARIRRRFEQKSSSTRWHVAPWVSASRRSVKSSGCLEFASDVAYGQVGQKAAEAFREKKYQKAAELYESIKNRLTPSELTK